MKRLALIGAAVLLAAQALNPGLATHAAAVADRIYVPETNPTRLRTFQFDGTAFAEAAPPLSVGIDSTEIAATDRFLLLGNNQTSLPLSIVDPVTGAELPRVTTTAAAFGAQVIPSADEQFAFIVGGGPSGAPPAGLSVVDLRIGSATFRREIAALTLPFAAGATNAATGACVLDSASGRLFVSSAETVGTTQSLRLVTIDVSNPLAPAVLQSALAHTPTPGAPEFERVAVNAMQLFSRGSTQFLLVARRTIQVYSVGVDGSLTWIQSLSSTSPAAGNRLRTVSDFRVASTGAGTIAFAATEVMGAPLGPDELIVLDMSPAGSGFNGSVLYAAPVGTPPTGSLNRLGMSSDGGTIYLTAASPRRLFAFSAPALLAHTATGPQASIVLDATPGTNGSFGKFLVRPRVEPASSTAISSLAVDGVAAAVLTNHEPRTLTITGSGLEGAAHVFVGLTEAAVTASSATSVTATVPALVPAATSRVVVMGPAGSAAATLTIANNPAYVAPNIVYADGFAGNDVSIINAATTTEVVGRFPTGQGPSDTAITPDGKYLFVGDFRANNVTVHSVVDDPVAGLTVGQRLATIDLGAASTQRIVMSPVRRRLYTAAAGIPLISIIGTDPNDSQTFLRVIAQVTVPGVSGGWRSMTITPDGNHLLLGGSAAPHLAVVNVATDAPLPADVALAALPGVPAVTGRTDGLAVSPDGSRLFFMTAGDTALRIFDIANLAAPAALLAVPVPVTPDCAVIAADNRRIQPSPDGRYVYISSRTRGCLDVFNPVTNAFVKSIRTGTFSGEIGVSPDSQFVFVSVAENDSVKTIDARETLAGAPNPGLHSILAATSAGQSTGSATVSPGLGTPVGEEVQTMPLPGVSVTYSKVEAAGHTIATSKNASDVALPVHDAIEGVPVFYDVSTTAKVAASIKVCVPFDTSSAVEPATLRLLHEEGGLMTDRTLSPIDAASGRICAGAKNLGQFVVASFVNQPPVCSAAISTVTEIRPANHRLVPIGILGVTDADGDIPVITITGIFQDEPTNSEGDGSTAIDGFGIGTSLAQVRAERDSNQKSPGNGRVYHVRFAADDGHGGRCTGDVSVGVPHDQGNRPAVDDGPGFDSTIPTPTRKGSGPS